MKITFCLKLKFDKWEEEQEVDMPLFVISRDVNGLEWKNSKVKIFSFFSIRQIFCKEKSKKSNMRHLATPINYVQELLISGEGYR